MGLAPFFERIYQAAGAHLQVSRESLTAKLSDVVVGIRIGREPTQNDVWIADLSINLLSRLYPRIAISGPDEDCQRLRQAAVAINPEIEFFDEASTANSIAIGGIDVENAIFPQASGWVAHVFHNMRAARGPSNPYAAGAAAAIACAELFRRILLKAGPEPDVSVSLLDFSQETGRDLELDPCHLGEAVFAGVGAVGNAAVWCLGRHETISGDFRLVDGEAVTLSNLQRYVLTTMSTIDHSKVQLAQDALIKTNLHIETKQLSLEGAMDEFDRNIPTLAACRS